MLGVLANEGFAYIMVRVAAAMSVFFSFAAASGAPDANDSGSAASSSQGQSTQKHLGRIPTIIM